MDGQKIKKLSEKAKKLPLLPGVYIMKNRAGEIIYIGKAKALKNRVSSYFRSVEKHLPKVYKMVENVEDFDYIVTDSEFEALVLECSMIKLHSPKYNILLKDDKGYSYIKVTPAPYSRLKAVLQKEDDQAEYIGPYMSSFVVKQTVEEANKVFKLPTCNRKFPQEFRKGRPCLNFHIKQCMGVCKGKISQKDYDEIFAQALEYIKGGGSRSIEAMRRQMEIYAENLQFEKAAQLRDRLKAISKINEQQKVVFASSPEQDIIALQQGENETCAVVLKFRQERLVDKEDFILGGVGNLQESRLEFLLRYYTTRQDIPKKIQLDGEMEDIDIVSQLLSEQAGHKVEVHIPKRGEQLKLVEMAKTNAAEKLSQRTQRTGREVAVLDELARLLGLPKPPGYIEAYDISNIGSETVVGGMIVFENGHPLRKAYRKFNIKTVAGTDDYASMSEVLSRRFQRYLNPQQQDEAFDRLPDLILLDGGKGHVSVITPLLRGMGINVPVFGMVKDDKHRTRAIAAGGGEIAINSSRSAFTLISSIQEEVHRYSIAFSRGRHQKSSFEMSLTKCPRIGQERAAQIYKHFKTIKAIKSATAQELAQVKGMTRPAAEKLYEFLHAQD
ncbi:excinuclease ABC subunit UvrC [Youxingia wuxianensis]|uniref:UvrABC system protein C n=1 Tax=Youxingia wuxianensis TaxID=2763678 RepID=A0A926EJM3_9FIRM|nr:excinuclease ABC subunit UvrC [Youxingia wuxianensis]MBC8584583.1 excinuclease ABC subunit UvrC [Youxingia wuxianensis]